MIISPLLFLNQLFPFFAGSLLALFNRRLSTTVFGWGSNDGGELGAGLGSDDQLIPKVLTSFKNVKCLKFTISTYLW